MDLSREGASGTDLDQLVTLFLAENDARLLQSQTTVGFLLQDQNVSFCSDQIKFGKPKRQ